MEKRLVADTKLLIKALGETGGMVKAVTKKETVTVYVLDGNTYVFRSEQPAPARSEHAG